MHHPSSRSAQRQTRHFLPRYATIQTMCCLTFCLQRKSRCTSCDLECMTEFSQRQTTRCVELFSIACYILITRAYERMLPCMYCITMYVTQNAVCNCEIKSILTYLLSLSTNQYERYFGSHLIITTMKEKSGRPNVRGRFR